MPLKRFLSIGLLSLYLVFSTGLVISLHYCEGNLADLKLFTKASCCCDDEEQAIPPADDCCKNEVKPIKITDEQFKNSQTDWIHKLVIDCSNELGFDYIIPLQNLVYIPIVRQVQQLPRPPDKALLIPAYQLNHAYLFYS